MIPISTYVKLGSIAALLLISAYFGYSFEHSRFMAYKSEIESIAKAQDTKNQAIRQVQEQINKSTKESYEAKLSAIKSYYGGMRLSSSGQMPSLSDSSTGANVEPSKLILDCAYSTQQLMSLQDWIKQINEQ